MCALTLIKLELELELESHNPFGVVARLGSDLHCSLVAYIYTLLAGRLGIIDGTTV